MPPSTDAFAQIGPNWFAAVMGTGIVATASLLLPVDVPALHALALAAWPLAVAVLGVLGLATALHWRRHAAHARRHLDNLAMAPFYGAPPGSISSPGRRVISSGRG